MKQVQLHDETNDKLNDIRNARREKSPASGVTKKQIIAELVDKAHKRECK